MSDEDWNRRELERHAVAYATFPEIHGRIVIAKLVEGGTIRLGRNVVIRSGFAANPLAGAHTVFLIKGRDAVIEIGDDVAISNAVIAARQRVTIEDGAWIGAGAKIMDTDFHALEYAERVANVDIPTRPVTIGRRAFIGMEAVVLKGVAVGEDAVIGARSVVSRSVPAAEVWAGNRARFVRRLRPSGTRDP
jgi:acetyltransferase-like isoleucine patch superfamily enzyme